MCKLLFQNRILKMGIVAPVDTSPQGGNKPASGSGRDVQPQPAVGSSVRVTQTYSPIFNKLYYTKLTLEVKIGPPEKNN